VAGNEGMPSNERSFDKYCASGREVRDCGEKFARRCLSDQQRETYRWALENGTIEAEQLCDKNNEIHKEVIRQSTCFNKGLKDRRRCLNELKIILEKVIEAPYNKKVTALCCTYRKMEKCVEETTIKHCGEGTVHLAKKMLFNMISIAELVCQGKIR
jgi:hypothetical protein